MANINVNSFKGYTSQLDGMARRPDLARECVNMVINNGQLCNIPYPRKILLNETNNFRNVGLYYNQRYNNNILFIYNAVPVSTSIFRSYHFTRTDNIGIVGEALQIQGIAMSVRPWPAGINNEYFPHDFVPTNPVFTNLCFANWVQIGTWIHFIGLFHDPAEAAGNLPRMLKFRPRSEISGLSNSAQRTDRLLIGIRAPAAAVYVSDAAGSMTNKRDWAFSLVNKFSLAPTGVGEDPIGKVDIQESNIVEDSGAGAYDIVSQDITFKITLPTGHPTFESQSAASQGILRYYSKKETQSIFYYTGEKFFVPSDITSEIDGTKTITIVVSTDIQDLTRPAEIHNVPNPSWHVATFKNRAYWLNAVIEQDQKLYWPVNQVQYSRTIISASGREASYIEDVFLVGEGDDALTGVIEYLGQLIIFKENITYILTDDVDIGELRVLFHNRGCVSKVGGKGYIIIDDVLYFLDSTGVYAWDGHDLPIKISKRIDDELGVMPKIQYKYARFGYDGRYNHIYLLFPDLSVTIDKDNVTRIPGQGFIYHPDERDEEGFGSWTSVASEKSLLNQGDPLQLSTEGSLIQVLSTKGLKLDNFSSSDEIPLVIANYTNYLYEQGLIDEPPDDNFDGRGAFYVSAIFDGGDASRLKTLKLLKFESSGLIQDGGLVGAFQFIDGHKNRIGGLVKINVTGIQYFGNSGNQPGFFYIIPNSKTPFRLMGFNLGIQLRGRR